MSVPLLAAAAKHRVKVGIGPPARTGLARVGRRTPVTIVAWDQLALIGLVQVLRDEPTIQLVGVAGTVDELPPGGSSDGPEPDLVVLHDRLPHGHPLKVARLLSHRYRVLLVCAFDALPCPLAALRAGADGLVSSRSGGDELRRALRLVAAGGTYVADPLAAVIGQRLAAATTEMVPATAENPAPVDPYTAGPMPVRAGPPLAPREIETLRWIAAGYTHTQTARRMGLSAGTVNTYVKRLRVKLRAANKAQLTLRAFELGLFIRAGSEFEVPRTDCIRT